MQVESGLSSRFRLRIDHYFYKPYDITDLYFVSQFCL